MKIAKSIVLSFCCLLLCACSTEKKVVVQNAEPDKVFVLAQSLIREKLPAAKLAVDTTARSIKMTDPGTTDYPPFVEIKFSRETSNTLVTVVADGDKQQLDNLYYLFSRGLLESKELPESTKPGYRVRTPRDALLDVNRDGFVSPEEDAAPAPPPPPRLLPRPY